jgi:peptide chain release factor 2
MRAEGQAHIDRIEAALALVRKFLDWDRALRRFDELNARVEDPKLWDNPKEAEAVMRERRRLEASIGAVNHIGQEMADAIEFIELGEMEGDEATIGEGLSSLAALAERADNDKVQALLAGEADASDTYIEVHAGAGGTESQDWAEMLQRMYSRWAERHGYKVELVDYHAGEQAGIKSATLLIKGENATAMPRPRAACTVWSASAPMIARRVGIRRSRRSGSIPWSMTTSRSTSIRRI